MREHSSNQFHFLKLNQSQSSELHPNQKSPTLSGLDVRQALGFLLLKWSCESYLISQGDLMVESTATYNYLIDRP